MKDKITRFYRTPTAPLDLAEWVDVHPADEYGKSLWISSNDNRSYMDFSDWYGRIVVRHNWFQEKVIKPRLPDYL